MVGLFCLVFFLLMSTLLFLNVKVIRELSYFLVVGSIVFLFLMGCCLCVLSVLSSTVMMMNVLIRCHFLWITLLLKCGSSIQNCSLQLLFFVF